MGSALVLRSYIFNHIGTLKKILAWTNFSSTCGYAKKANESAAAVKLNQDFYDHHYCFISSIETTNFTEFLVKNCIELESFGDFLLSEAIFPLTIKVLRDVLTKWKSETLAGCTKYLQDNDFTYINPACTIALFKAIKDELKNFTVDENVLHKLEFSAIASRLSASLHFTDNHPRETVIKTRLWTNFTNFHEVLALEYFFPGNDFLIMVQIYTDWSLKTNSTEKWKISTRIPKNMISNSSHPVHDLEKALLPLKDITLNSNYILG